MNKLNNNGGNVSGKAQAWGNGGLLAALVAAFTRVGCAMQTRALGVNVMPPNGGRITLMSTDAGGALGLYVKRTMYVDQPAIELDGAMLRRGAKGCLVTVARGDSLDGAVRDTLALVAGLPCEGSTEAKAALDGLPATEGKGKAAPSKRAKGKGKAKAGKAKAGKAKADKASALDKAISEL